MVPVIDAVLCIEVKFSVVRLYLVYSYRISHGFPAAFRVKSIELGINSRTAI